MRPPDTASGRMLRPVSPTASRQLVGTTSRARSWGQKISAAIAVLHDRNIGAERKLEIDRVEEMDAVGIHSPNVGGGDSSTKGLDLFSAVQAAVVYPAYQGR
jgi:hypothetical protein